MLLVDAYAPFGTLYGYTEDNVDSDIESVEYHRQSLALCTTGTVVIVGSHS